MNLARPAPGAVLCVYANSGIANAVPRALPLVQRSRPGVVMLHSGPDDLAAHAPAQANALRSAVPGVEIWLAIGCDHRLRQQRLSGGRYDGEAVVQHLASIADSAAHCGATVAMLDPESEWELLGKHDPSLADSIAREVLTEIRRRAPRLTLAFTSFDFPTYHAAFPWRAWLGPASPMTMAFAQCYASPEHGIAGRGQLEARERGDLASWATAVRAGWIRPDVEPDVPDDVDWYPYLQLHGVPAVDTIRVGVERAAVAGWAAGADNAEDLCDADGTNAWLAICELRRRGYWGADAVVRFQREVGLAADGIAGPKTLAALGATA
ncbi:MAG TPA: peptidoglycan-binding domain-containing protein [Kofleriaceae bacterium]|nr:peptidoglycan-binding domain-containing protein [Kofleriaceae bacterium]